VRRGARPLILLAAALFPGVRAACAAETGFLDRALEDAGATWRYQVFVPSAFDPGRRWPVILFLHGGGERGSDGLRQTGEGLGNAIRQHPERFPAIVVFPQAPAGERWSGTAARHALEALDRSIREFHGDPARVYVVGLSMGGYGVVEIAGSHPERFAAAVSVCGGVFLSPAAAARHGMPPFAPSADPYGEAAERLKGIPVRLYHGADDDSVPVEESRLLAAALEARGANVKYVEYPGVGHGSWIPAFDDPELWRWLLAQNRALTPAPQRR
jgi:predicted peptidase